MYFNNYPELPAFLDRSNPEVAAAVKAATLARAMKADETTYYDVLTRGRHVVNDVLALATEMPVKAKAKPRRKARARKAKR
jgi:hypothetical protein